MIPYGKQNINQDDILAVMNVLKSDWLTQGPCVPAFESAIAKYCIVKNAVAVNSATSALHIACLALDVSEDDIVWTSPISFVASANCAIYCGAKIDFIDIDINTANISVTALKEKLIHAKLSNTLPKVIIVVHMAGLSCNMEPISLLANEFGISIIEDASHAIGAYYQESPVGKCQYSDITIFSFHPVKIITTAEGGIATTNSKKLADKMSQLRSHGVIKNKALLVNQHQGDWYYEQQTLGFNYRMTEMQAALGLSQLTRLTSFIEIRQNLAQRYQQEIAHLPMVYQQQNKQCYSSYHLFIVRLTNDSPLSREQLFKELKQANIGVNVHYIPIHTQPYYQNLGFQQGDFPQAELYYQDCLSLPLYADLSDSDFSYIISTLNKLLNNQ
jgi:UDP-4-amino-4,6-dideoxy-N-acetyl-beta-L-altrosamine transaminase